MVRTPWEKKPLRESPKKLIRKPLPKPDDIRKTLVFDPNAQESKYSLQRKYSLIERGKKENLRHALGLAEEALMPFRAQKRQYDKRMGVVTKVLEGDRIIVSSEVGYLVVKIKYVDTPSYQKDPEGWRKAKQFLESLLLNQTVILKISANERNFAGDTLAEVYLAGRRTFRSKPSSLNLTLPDLTRKGKSALFGGDVPLYEYNVALDESIRYENSVSQKIVEAGFSLSADEFRAKSIADQKRRMARQIERVVQKAKEQAALPTNMRERPPPSWSDMDFWDKINSIQYMTQAEAINFIVFLKTGKWGIMSVTDKLAAGKIFKRLLDERDKKRNDPNNPLNELGIYKYRNEMIEFIGNVMGDPLLLVGWGRGLFTKVLQVRGKTIPLTYAGEKAWIKLIGKYGEFEAKWHMLRLIKENPNYIQKEGLRILGTNIEIGKELSIESLSSGIFTNKIKVPNILTTVSRHAVEKTEHILYKINSFFDRFKTKQPISNEEIAEVKASFKNLIDRLRLQKQLATAEVIILEDEAKGVFKKEYTNELRQALNTLDNIISESSKELRSKKDIAKMLSGINHVLQATEIRKDIGMELAQHREETKATLRFIAKELKDNLDKIERGLVISDVKEQLAKEAKTIPSSGRATIDYLTQAEKTALKEGRAIEEAIFDAEKDVIESVTKQEIGEIRTEYVRFKSRLSFIIEKNVQLPTRLKLISDKVTKLYDKFADEEIPRGLLTIKNKAYTRHIITKEAADFFKINRDKLSTLDIKTAYDIARKHKGDIGAVNQYYLKKYGFKFFEDDAYKALEYRYYENIETTFVYDWLIDFKIKYGKSLEQLQQETKGSIRNKIPIIRKYIPSIPEGYAQSKIPLLRDVYFPKVLVVALESQPMFALHIKTVKELNPNILMKAFKNYQSVRYGFQRIVTAYYAAFYARNVASGTYENIRHGMVNPRRVVETERVLAATDDPVHSAIRAIKKGYGETGSDFAFISERGETFTAERIRDIARKGKILNQPGMIDVNRNVKPWETASKLEFLSSLPRAMLKSTENRLRMSLLIDRLHRGDSEEAAIAFVNSVHFDYFRDLSRAEVIASQFMPFTTFRTQNMLLQTSFLAKHPGIATLPPKVAMTWNSEEDEVMLSYKPDYLQGAILLKVPGTQDAFARVPLQSEDLTMLPNYFSTTAFGFYWDEAKTNTNIILKFAKYNLGVEWLRNGGGVPVYNEATGEIKITYKKTGESITAKMNPEGTELVFYDDVKNEVIKTFKVESKGGKQQVLKDNDPAKKLAKQYLYPWFVTPFELAEQKDYRTGAPIPLDNPEDYVSYFLLTYGGSRFKYNIEVAGDPLTESWEAFFELGLGWNIYHAKDWMILPDEAREVIAKHEIKKLFGNYRGCGY